MYERFTDPARRAMQFSNRVAQRYQHDYIGTQHILLGLVEEGSGVALVILNNLKVDLRTFRSEVKKIVQHGPDVSKYASLVQTPRAKRVIEYAVEEAQHFNHNYVGTEHLLLGLTRQADGTSQLLLNVGVRPDDVREEVVRLGLREPGSPSPEQTGTQATTRPRFDARSLGRFVGGAARAVGRWLNGRTAI